MYTYKIHVYIYSSLLMTYIGSDVLYKRLQYIVIVQLLETLTNILYDLCYFLMRPIDLSCETKA